MNKSAIKTYAVWARTELIKLVTQRAYEYEVTADNTPAYNTDSVHGRPLENEEKKQLNELIDEVNKHGFEHVIEEVAYTWFNRFIALRYMEVNNYIPQKVRVFTNENNEFKPELLTDAIHIELDGLDKQKVFDLVDHNNQEELYKYLLLTLCNDMNQYLPDMFASISDYKSLLMPNNLLREDSIIGRMITDIDEDGWNDQVQIIGWLYQYYNSELKDIVMKKKSYTKDDIPAATQLFTPDWIVRYMTENSLGRLWLDGHPDFDHSKWKYYLEEAEQEPEVLEQLKKIREEHAKLKPEDIKVIDPCMGSGHILVYAFDVLMDIYRDSGYTDRNAAKSILENNIYGLEIDERAYHLAYFALMMKARSYNRRILSKATKVNILEIREPIGELKEEHDHYLGDYTELSHYLVNEFAEAKELGSIINLSCTSEQLEELEVYLNSLKSSSMNQDMISDTEINEIKELMSPLIRQAKLLVQKYDVVITNPPYMPPSPIQKKYVQKNYPDSKSDLFAIFIEKCHELTKKNAYQAMITMHSWMFLSSYEKLRKKLLKDNVIINMAHLGARAFEDIGGEVVQTTAFVFDNANIKNYQSSFKRLVGYNSQNSKEVEFLKDTNSYTSFAENFSKIPGSPIAYWKSESYLYKYANAKKLTDFGVPKAGLATGNNSLFERLWYEVKISNIGFDLHSAEETNILDYKWYPCNSGGTFRKWYFNNEYIVNWFKNGYEIKHYKNQSNKFAARPQNVKYYFKEGLTWNKISSSKFAVKHKANGFIFDDTSRSLFIDDSYLMKYILGFMCSKVAFDYMTVLNPSMSFTNNDIERLPIIESQKKEIVVSIVDSNLIISKKDWDSFETSWDFMLHPLVKYHVKTISEAYSLWDKESADRFDQLKTNEEELNKIFIDIYGLQDELDPYEEDKDVTVRKADLVRDVKSFISYSVGCMFGRYSLDTEGLAYDGGEWDNNKYKTFIPDADDIIPICDEDYFEDDIVSRFIEFVRCVYGDDTLEENIKFISDALGGNGNPRDVLRNYFLKDFFKDHCNTYQVTGSGKRPIYWQFDSGKKNGFKALVYIHRYTPDLIARMRTGYIHPLQSQYRTQIEMLNNQIDEASSTSEKVRLQKQLKKITEQAEELGKYEEKIHHWADKMEPMDLDDGVVVNYNKFQELLTPNVVKKLKEVKK